MILHLVTDRRRLQARPCRSEDARALPAAQAALRGRGRHRLHPACASAIWRRALLADLVIEVVGLTRGTRTRVVVNDRLDVALASGARRRAPARRFDSVAEHVRRMRPPDS